MRLAEIPQNPVPANATVGEFDSFDGKSIRYAYWKPDNSSPKGTICLFSGRTEYIEKYFEVISELLSRGFVVSVMDWRGQGGSARMLKNPVRGYVKTFDDYEKDATIYLKQIVEPNCPRPFYGLGHSMGGHMLFRLCALEDCPFDSAVLCSPMMGLSKERAPMSTSALKKIATFMQLLGRGNSYFSGGSDVLWDTRPFDGNQITPDQVRYERASSIIASMPELGIADPTVSWIKAACASMIEVSKPEFINRIEIPVLVLGSGDDKIVDTPTTEQIAKQIKNGKFLSVPDAWHELMMERDVIRQQFWKAFDEFVG